MLELLISEFMLRGYCDFRGASDCTTDSFIEIYNNSDAEFTLEGWHLEYRNAGTGGDYGKTLTVLAELAPLNSYSYATYPVQIGNSAQGYLQLANDAGEVIDLVGYGKSAALHAAGGSPAPAPSKGKSATRCEVSGTLANTLNNTADFQVLDAPTPNTGHPCAPPAPETPATPDEPTAIAKPDDDQPTAPTNASTPVIPCSVAGLGFSEFYTYYQNSEAEQFIELYNHSPSTVPLAGCQLLVKYGTKYSAYTFTDEVIEAENYYAIFLAEHHLKIAKDPGAETVKLVGDATLVAPNLKGQKAGKSYALFGDLWQTTLDITPNGANALQLCPADKILNDITGKCVNPPVTKLPKECDDGYERNPETNRCRLIRTNVGADADYALPDTGDTPTQKFLAPAAIAAAAFLALAALVFHFRAPLKARLHDLLAHFRKQA
jgi:hypothetical protein